MRRSAAAQGRGARRSGDGRGRRPRGEAERRPAQLGGAGARGSTVQGHADKARDNGGGGRVPAPAVHKTKGEKAGEHE